MTSTFLTRQTPEQLRALILEYIRGAKQAQQLIADSGLSGHTFYYWMQKLGIKRGMSDEDALLALDHFEVTKRRRPPVALQAKSVEALSAAKSIPSSPCGQSRDEVNSRVLDILCGQVDTLQALIREHPHNVKVQIDGANALLKIYAATKAPKKTADEYRRENTRSSLDRLLRDADLETVQASA